MCDPAAWELQNTSWCMQFINITDIWPSIHYIYTYKLRTNREITKWHKTTVLNQPSLNFHIKWTECHVKTSQNLWLYCGCTERLWLCPGAHVSVLVFDAFTLEFTDNARWQAARDRHRVAAFHTSTWKK